MPSTPPPERQQPGVYVVERVRYTTPQAVRVLRRRVIEATAMGAAWGVIVGGVISEQSLVTATGLGALTVAALPLLRRAMHVRQVATGGDIDVWLATVTGVRRGEGRALVGDLYDYFAGWCAGHRVAPMSRSAFAAHLTAGGYLFAGKTETGRKFVGGLTLTSPEQPAGSQ